MSIQNLRRKDNISERARDVEKSPRRKQPMAYAQGNKWAEENARAVGNNN